MRYTVTIRYGSPDGAVMADLTPYATACYWAHNEHGCRDVAITVPRRLVSAFNLYSATGRLFVTVHRGIRPMWIGRISGLSLAISDDTTIVVRALGLWHALDDLVYTAYWIDPFLDSWRVTKPNELANRQPDRFVTDNERRLFIGLKKNAIYESATTICDYTIAVPRGSVTLINAFYVAYNVLLPVGFRVRAIRWDQGLTTEIATIWTITATGALQTGTLFTGITGTERITITVDQNSGAPITYTGEDGDNYARFTQALATYETGFSNTYVGIEEIITDVVNRANTLNGCLPYVSAIAFTLSPATANGVFVDSKGTDVVNALVNDVTYSASLSPRARYVAGVDASQNFFMHRFGTGGNTYYVDISDIDVERDYTTVRNSVYASYDDFTSGERLLSQTVLDNISINQVGSTRQAIYAANVVSSSAANGAANAYLSDFSNPNASSKIRILAVRNQTGGRVPLDEVLPGDTIVVRNLPIVTTISDTVDKIRSFQVLETKYDPISNILELTPESPLPELDAVIAQGSN